MVLVVVMVPAQQEYSGNKEQWKKKDQRRKWVRKRNPEIISQTCLSLQTENCTLTVKNRKNSIQTCRQFPSSVLCIIPFDLRTVGHISNRLLLHNELATFNLTQRLKDKQSNVFLCQELCFKATFKHIYVTLVMLSAVRY